MKKILLPALALLLASCGFHLKGTGVTSQPLPYQNWHVEGGAVMQKRWKMPYAVLTAIW